MKKIIIFLFTLSLFSVNSKASNQFPCNRFNYPDIECLTPIETLITGSPNYYVYDCPEGYTNFGSTIKWNGGYYQLSPDFTCGEDPKESICCIKRGVDHCPYPSFCYKESLSSKGYTPIHDSTCTVDGTGETGSCWVAENLSESTCFPIPSRCEQHMYKCGPGHICDYEGGGWKCVVDKSKLCEGKNTCVMEGLEGVRKCVDGWSCPQGFSVFPWAFCGDAVTSQRCCQKEDLGNACLHPGVCIAKECPEGFILAHRHPQRWIFKGEIKCSSEKLKCCIPFQIGDAKEAEYKGPVITSLEEILGPIVKILYYGGLFIGVFFIILSGYRLMVSQGNPQKTQDVKENQLVPAIVGIVFILLSVTLLRIILTKVLGLSIDF